MRRTADPPRLLRSTTRERLVIVGGGLVGSLLAVYLARRGFGVDVFDRQSGARGEPGARPSINLTLCERGIRALAEVGLADRVLELCVPVRGRRIHARDGSIADQPYGNHGEAIYSISRSELGALLVSIATQTRGVTYHHDQRCVHVDTAAGTARFENTRTGAVAEVAPTKIFGADGAYSGVRLQLQKTALFDYSQQYSTQGYKELAIPAAADGDWLLRPDALHIWPRGQFMLIAFPNANRSFTCALYAPFHGAHSLESLTTEPELVAFMREFFPDIAERIPNLGAQFFGRAANTMVTVKCQPWSRAGNVLLVGDAAHAILPSYGQGANAGFEDCAVLDRCLDEHETWADAFTAFEHDRKPNMDVIADLCVDHFSELREHVGDPSFLLRKTVERGLEELDPARFTSLYSNIAFSRMSYVEAVRRDRVSRAAVDRVLSNIPRRLHDRTDYRPTTADLARAGVLALEGGDDRR